MKKGEPKLPLFLKQLTVSLVAFVLASVSGPVETSWQQGVDRDHRDIQADCEVAFRTAGLSTHQTEVGKTVAILEVRLSDDVTFKSRRCRDSVVTATAQIEDQLRTGRHRRCGGLRGGCCSATRRGSIVVQGYVSSLRRSPVRILRGRSKISSEPAGTVDVVVCAAGAAPPPGVVP